MSIHVQGGERYKDCITIKELDKMKKTAFLINTSRGPIINEDDLIIALSTNEIAGAGLDVYEKEPLPENNKLRFLPNALLTCLLYTSPSPRDKRQSRMPSSA